MIGAATNVARWWWPGQVVFRRDLIREVADEQVPTAVRTAPHPCAARCWRAAGAPVERVAKHLSTGPAMDRDAIVRITADSA